VSLHTQTGVVHAADEWEGTRNAEILGMTIRAVEGI
jgi:hypothetical protein